MNDNSKEAARIRVLIADDHAMVREGIRALLEMNADIEIVGEAADGQEAVDMAHRLEPDVAVIDIRMPVLDGIEATRQIVGHNRDVKVVALSRHDNISYVRSILSAGAVGYVLKRAVSAELASAIRAAQLGEIYIYPAVAKSLVEDYVQLLASDSRTDEKPYPLAGLSAREKQVFALTVEGKSCRDIAKLLYVSPKTVANYRVKIMRLLGVSNNAELVKLAMRLGLTEEDP